MHARHRAQIWPIIGIVVLLIIVAGGAAYFLSNRHSNPNNSTTTALSASTASITTPTTSIKATLTTTIGATTPVGSSSQLRLPPPQPQSQIVRTPANTTVTNAGAFGGLSPYRYQWLGAVMNTSSNFTASFGDSLCLNATAQSTTCNFQTASGYNSLIPGTYYLKLHVSDSSYPVQAANSPVAYVNVIG